jgi:NADH-quinone oxidoreductase subunit G
MAMAGEIPVLSPVPEIATPACFRIAGEKIPRQPHRYSGRTAMHAHVGVHEPTAPRDPDSPLAFSMEGFQGQLPASLIAHYWTPGWNSVQALNKSQEEVGGPLRGGDPGRRLIEPGDGDGPPSREGEPEPFSPREDRWLVVPLYHVFGSEELSALAPGVAELVPKPYVALSPRDADRLQVAEGEEIEMVRSGAARRYPVRIEASLRQGIAGLSADLPETAGRTLPEWFALRRPTS